LLVVNLLVALYLSFQQAFYFAKALLVVNLWLLRVFEFLASFLFVLCSFASVLF